MIHVIMAPSKDAITETQLGKIEKYQSKETPLTDRQRQELNSLLNKRDSAPEISFSGSAQSYLLFLYRVKKYGKQYILRGEQSEAIMKGLKKEKSAADLISEAYGIDLYRDKSKVRNDYLTGIIDIMDAPTIIESQKVHEIKNCCDLGSFLRIMNKPLQKKDYLQMQGYLSIFGKESGEIHYCLTEYTDETIQEQKDIIMTEMCPDGVVTEKFEQYWYYVERKLRYSDMPVKERVFTHLVHKDDEIIKNIHQRVEDARDWLHDYARFHEKVIENRYLDAKKIRI